MRNSIKCLATIIKKAQCEPVISKINLYCEFIGKDGNIAAKIHSNYLMFKKF